MRSRSSVAISCCGSSTTTAPPVSPAKLHALLQRSYAKGRDLYDLVWYLSARDWPAPNLVLLRDALRQTGWQGPEPAPETWREIAAERVRSLDWARVAADVEPSLESRADPELVTRENLLRLLG
jgi:Nucleotidyl transferase AbiEii toxin, Type IV TA system